MAIHYLIDVSWMLYRGYFSSNHIWDEYPELHFLIKKLESLLSRKDATVHLCLDGWNTTGRRLLGESYKAGRHQEDSYNVYKGLSSFIHMLHNDRIKIYYGEMFESDEIVFTLSQTLEGRKRILSGDKDLLQALRPDVVIESAKGLITTNESYKLEYADKFFEIDPEKLPIFRAITGDASDTLKPPVARFPRKLAARIVKELDYSGECPTVAQLNNLIASDNYKESEINWIRKLISAYDSFKLNFEIMKLNVISQPLNENYNYPEVEFSDFLKHKIDHLNTL